MTRKPTPPIKLRIVTDTDQASRFIVAGLLVILAALLWVLAHPVVNPLSLN